MKRAEEGGWVGGWAPWPRRTRCMCRMPGSCIRLASAQRTGSRRAQTMKRASATSHEATGSSRRVHPVRVRQMRDPVRVRQQEERSSHVLRLADGHSVHSADCLETQFGHGLKLQVWRSMVRTRGGQAGHAVDRHAPNHHCLPRTALPRLRVYRTHTHTHDDHRGKTIVRVLTR